MNSFGRLFRLTSFGESHGTAIGGVVDGMIPGITLDVEAINQALSRRRPGQSALTTARKEPDRIEILSGVFEGKTTGTPIGFIIRNTNQKSADYDELSKLFRPSHADFTYQQKYGIRDYRGGGRASARETAVRVAGGAIAMQALSRFGIGITAFTSSVGDIGMSEAFPADLSRDLVESNAVRCPDAPVASRMEALIAKVKAEGDTVGGVVSCIITGCPVGLGEPVFDKFHAALGAAMLGINAAKGFEYGCGFEAARHRGSELNDAFVPSEERIGATATNFSGGIQGGITNGNAITFRVAFKPAPTLLREQQTIDTDGMAITMKARGRHDPCVVPRAVPIVEAMAAMTTLDFLLLAGKDRMLRP